MLTTTTTFVLSRIKDGISNRDQTTKVTIKLIVAVPPSNKGKIPGQPEDLETANLVDIHNAAYYCIQPSTGRWIDYTLSKKKSDPRRPVIHVAIGPYIFQEAVYDFGASVNTMPKVIYVKILGHLLLYTNMRL